MIRKKLLLLGIVLITNATAFGEVQMEGSPSELRQHFTQEAQFTTISGTGEVTVRADKAKAYLRVEAETGSLQKSMEKIDDYLSAIRKSLASAGIAEEDIAIDDFSSSSEKGGWFSGDTYLLTNNVTVTLDDPKKLGEVSKIVDRYEDIDLLRLSFEDSKQKQNEAAALAKAFENLKAKRELIEGSMGLVLKPLKLDTGDSMGTDAIVKREISKSYLRSSPSADFEVAEPVSSSKNLQFQSIIYNATVRVNYTLAD